MSICCDWPQSQRDTQPINFWKQKIYLATILDLPSSNCHFQISFCILPSTSTPSSHLRLKTLYPRSSDPVPLQYPQLVTTFTPRHPPQPATHLNPPLSTTHHPPQSTTILILPHKPPTPTIFPTLSTVLFSPLLSNTLRFSYPVLNTFSLILQQRKTTLKRRCR